MARLPADRWNHNLHYSGAVLRALPPGCRRVLDVGCGEGTLTRQLRARVPEVVGVDADPASVQLARAQDPAGSIRYELGDFLTLAWEAGSFDAVVSVAALHHLDAEAALARMAVLLRPGGVLVVVGLARSGPLDLPLDALAVPVDRWYRWRRGYWQHPSPTRWPPPYTYAEVGRLAAGALPGCRFRRRLLWRYTLTWTRPAGGTFSGAGASMGR